MNSSERVETRIILEDSCFKSLLSKIIVDDTGKREGGHELACGERDENDGGRGEAGRSERVSIV